MARRVWRRRLAGEFQGVLDGLQGAGFDAGVLDVLLGSEHLLELLPSWNSPKPPRDLTLERTLLRSPTPAASSFISPRP